MLTVLSVAYPLAAVREDTSGGAEQVLAMLDAALGCAGHRSIVVAQEGSEVAGTLVPIPRPRGPLDENARAEAQAHHRAAIARALERWPVDVVHMHGQDFRAYLPPPGVPVLATLHVPREWYPAEVLHLDRPGTFLHCVSETQRAAWPADLDMLDPIPNGVDADRLACRVRKRGFALALGRISPEKGTHVALDAAAHARFPLLVAGEVYGYEAHRRYFSAEVLPRLGAQHRYLGPIGFARKRRLLAAARCLLLPSQAPETSSLGAMEALACGTPVVAFPAGALAEIVDHGRTGFLVHTAAEMADAIAEAAALDPEECRRTARERFSSARTIGRYFALYQRLANARLAHDRTRPA